ncbi:MAG: PQQ-dependent dehydrogenase, methanol/ethanol family [Acidobacteria bacterium]|nr:PQQ-dependent dehydrogenase, methanol/ethanol family [Acidobacteriota bacterium]
MHVLLFIAFAVPLLAQHPTATLDGVEIFRRNCSACHGDNAKGGRAPDLTTGQFKHGATDEQLLRNITKGIAGTQMPAIPLPPEEGRTVVAYLRRLAGSTTVDGDANAGDRVFVAQCAQCHMVQGRGGNVAADLSNAASRFTPPALAKALAAAIPMVQFGGVSAIRKGEDTFTLQARSLDGRWHLIDKQKTRFTKQSSPHVTLSSGQQRDVIAFLMSNRAPSVEPRSTPAADFNVTFDRLRNASTEPQNWLTYWGNLRGTHYSALQQITPANAAKLQSAWTFQMGGNTVETTPLVVDGMMFVTGPLNNAAALDARTGRPLWRYARRLPQIASHCTVMTNRGFAMLGDRLYMATLDTHLVALDAKSGNVLFDIEVDDYKKGFSITHAPLAIDGKIIVGVTSGECALTGFVDAYDAATGKRLWRTHSTPQPGDPNRKTWAPESSADYGGAPTWTTGTYDVETNTIFWMTGNPGPDYDGPVREGDNLYSCSVLALDAATGKMRWWFQFTPHDVHDWDANQTPVLIDAPINGKPRKLLVTAQRNGFYYVLDRMTGEFLAGQAFAKQTWAKGLDAKGRPIVLPNTNPTPQGNYVCPDAAGTANWGSPSYDPSTNFFIVSVREACATYTSITKLPVPGEGYTGGGVDVDPAVGTPGSVRALDALTGARRWDFPFQIGSSATGVVATAGGVVFASSNDGNLIALDSRSGRYLWHYNTGANIIASPMTYAVNGQQYIAIASQSSIITFRLP